MTQHTPDRNLSWLLVLLQAQKVRRLWGYPILVSLALIVGTAGNGYADEVALFREIPAADALSTKKPQSPDSQEPERARIVDLNLAVLSAKSPARIPQIIHFNLFAGLSFSADLAEVDWRSVDHYTWTGTLPGHDLGYVILVVEGTRIAANLYVGAETYQVRPLPGGRHLIRRWRPPAFTGPKRSDVVDWPAAKPDGREAVELPPGKATDDGSVIDVLVVYTTAAAAATGDIQAEIRLAIAEANWTFANSEILPRLRLVRTVEVDYYATGDLHTDLNHVDDPEDGCVDEVPHLRDVSRADLVSFWVERDDPEIAGVANQFRSDSTIAYHVVERDLATGGFVFAHETGHNIGAHHDWWVEGCLEDWPYIKRYSRGYVNQDEGWRTVMAYRDQCEQASVGCPRQPFWSSPSLFIKGSPTGFEEGTTVDCDSVPYEEQEQPFTPPDPPGPADNARTLTDNATVVANFRNSTVAAPRGNAYQPVAVGEPTLAAGSWRKGSGVQYRLKPDNTVLWTPTMRVELVALGGGSFVNPGDIRIFLGSDTESVTLYSDAELINEIGDHYAYDAGTFQHQFWFIPNFNQDTAIRLKHWRDTIGIEDLFWDVKVHSYAEPSTASPMQVSPGEGLRFVIEKDSPFQSPTGEYTLSNIGVDPINYKVVVDHDTPHEWILVSLSGGTLVAGEQRTAEVTLDSVVEDFDLGTYRAHVHFSNLSGDGGPDDDISRMVELVVEPPNTSGAGQIFGPSGSVVGLITVQATASDPDGLDTVSVDFVAGGQRLLLCGAGAPDACSGTSETLSRSGVDPSAYGATPGTVTAQLFVKDVNGRESVVDTHSFTWTSDTGSGSTFTLTVTKQGDGGGTISSTSGVVQCGTGCTTQSVAIEEGTSVTLSGVADPGFLFLGFAGDRCYGMDPCTFTMSSDLTVRASFGTPDSFRAIGSDPGSGDTGVATSSNVRVTFNREIDLGPNQGAITIVDGGGTQVPFNTAVSSSERRLSLNPVSSFQESTTYTVTIPAGAVLDDAGEPLPDDYVFSFETGSLGDPQIFVAAFPRKIQEGYETTVTIWFDRPQPFARTVTLQSSSGDLFHPSQVTVPADEISINLQVDTRRDHGDYDDHADTLVVAEPGSGTDSVALEIINWSNIPGSDFRLLAFNMIDDEDHDGIFEAFEDARFHADVWNGGDSSVSMARIDFSIPNASTWDLRMLDESCFFGTLDPHDHPSCEVDVRSDDEVPPGEYLMRLDGSSSSGFEFLEYFNFNVVNNALPDYDVWETTGSSPVLNPGDTIIREFDARNIGDGFQLDLPIVQVLLQDPYAGGEDVVIGETLANVRHEEGNEQTLIFTITAPAVPGVYSVRAVINPPPNQLPEADYGNNESSALTITVVGPNHPPVLDPVGGPFSVNGGETMSFTAIARDPGGDGLSFSLDNAPAGAAIDPVTGTFTWSPTDAQGPQTYFPEVVVTDDHPLNPLSDRETIEISVTRSVDLGVAKSVDPAAAAPGEPVVFTVTVTNHGPGGASGATLSDPVPVGLTDVTWTCAATGGSCTASGVGELVDSHLDLDRDGVATYTIRATLAEDAPSIVTNTATVSVPAPAEDHNGSNDSAATTVSVVEPSCRLPDAGDWVVSSSCTLWASAVSPASVIVEPGVVVTVNPGVVLEIDLQNHKLLVRQTGGVLIRKGGTIRQAISTP